MNTKEHLLTIIHKQFSKMSRGQKKIAAYLTEHYDKAAFFTAAQIAAEVGVSESTVVRFAGFLGYDGFPELHRALEQLVEKRLDSKRSTKLDRHYSNRKELIQAVFESDMAKLEDTASELDLNAFDIAVENILHARHVYIIGLRNCAPLAECLHFYLHMICPDITLLNSTNHSEIFEQMMRISDKDVLIGISFPRYSMRTLKAMELANSRNARIITITDSVYSPMNLYSSCRLLAKSDLSSVVDSLVAPLSVINALVMALYMERQDEVLHNMAQIEQLWEDYQIYSKDEINFFDPQKGTHLND